ncbi:hypothetical protein BaRGS_00012775, partial [Batillaria attramentaria]
WPGIGARSRSPAAPYCVKFNDNWLFFAGLPIADLRRNKFSKSNSYHHGTLSPEITDLQTDGIAGGFQNHLRQTTDPSAEGPSDATLSMGSRLLPESNKLLLHCWWRHGQTTTLYSAGIARLVPMAQRIVKE